MKLKNAKKIILISVIMFFIVGFIGNSVMAAINGNYTTAQPVDDSTLEIAVEWSSVLGLLGHLVYAVGQLIEWLSGVIIKLLTGSSEFPWADKIVFNSVALLDVNFINPDVNSFVGQPMIQSALRNLYSTILTLAVAFFGIVVMITAIKLVASTIASEKAKYKQAIVDWLVGFIMLFCIHYAISFIFYLNEQLVEVASNIVTEELKDYNSGLEIGQGEHVNNLIDSVGETTYNGSGKYNGKKIADILRENEDVLNKYMDLSQTTSMGIHSMLMADVGFLNIESELTIDSQRQALAWAICWAIDDNVSVERLQQIANNEIFGVRQWMWAGIVYSPYFGQAMENRTLVEIFGDYKSELAGYTDYVRQYKKDLTLLETKTSNANTRSAISDNELLWWSPGFDDIASDSNWFLEGWRELNTSFGGGYEWNKLIDDLIELKKTAQNSSTNTDTDSSSNYTSLITDLAKYFKNNVYEVSSDPNISVVVKRTGRVYVQNMLMYAILVGQSLMLFIAYIKRLFYVVLMAMMAPIVVVVDFFQKFGK